MLVHLLERIDKCEFEHLAEDVKQVLQDHRDWMRELNLALVTRQSVNPMELISDGTHRRCSVGCWLNRLFEDELFHHPYFFELDKLHQDLHDQARQLMDILSCEDRVDANLLACRIPKKIFSIECCQFLSFQSPIKINLIPLPA